MRAYSSMPTEDFIYQLRTLAIGAKASPLVIDQIDAIVAGPTEDEIDERINEAVESAKDEAYDDGYKEGEANKEEEIAKACKALYTDICAAIEKRGGEKDIGLTEIQIDQVINWIMPIRLSPTATSARGKGIS